MKTHEIIKKVNEHNSEIDILTTCAQSTSDQVSILFEALNSALDRINALEVLHENDKRIPM